MDCCQNCLDKARGQPTTGCVLPPKTPTAEGVGPWAGQLFSAKGGIPKDRLICETTKASTPGSWVNECLSPGREVGAAHHHIHYQHVQ